MADDLYAALIGEGANNPEKSAIIAAALRRRNQMGMLGQITGDKVLVGAGRELTNSSDDYAKQLQSIREHGIDNAQTEKYQGGQLRYMNDNLAETRRNNDMDHEYQMAMAEAAGIRANRPPGGGKIPKLRQGDIKELQDLSQTIGAIDSLQGFIGEGGSFGAKKVAGVAVPGSRALANTAAAMGYGSEADKKTFAAKQNWDLFYNIANRNRMFGATLTDAEKKSWADANPSGSQTDDQITKALPVMKKVFEHRMKAKASGLMKEGYNAEALADYADIQGVNSPVGGAGLAQDAGPAPPGAAPPAGVKPKRWVEQADGTFKQE